MNADNSIKKQIESGLQADELLNKYNIEVDVENGNVILNGNVETEAEISYAEEVARVFEGVESVTTNLSMQWTDNIPAIPVPDTTHHQDSPGSSGAFPVGAFDTSKD